MDEAGVDRAVLLPAAWDRMGNELVSEAAEANPDRFAAFLSVDVRKPLPVMSEPSGLRLMFPPGVRDSWLEDGSSDWVWPAAEAAGAPLMLWMPGHLPALAAILDAHPALRVVVDHLNLTMDARSSDVARETAELFALAAFPNLSVKVSALPCAAADSYPYRSVFAPVREAIDNFGPDRVFWGSDLNRLPCTYMQALTMFTEEMPMITDHELRMVMGDGFKAWLGWPEQSHDTA
jgi:predicted TIM-barrel fold metal-dependent hydrolase